MENKIEIKIGDNKLVVSVNDWKDGMPKEVCTYITDNSGVILQDICMVREHYHYCPKTENFEIDSSLVDVKVWADSDNEDYTDEFTIAVFEEEE